MGTPKSSILIGFSIINHPFWGTPIFGNTHFQKTLGESTRNAIAMDGYGSSDGSADFEDLDDDEVWRAEDDGKGWVDGGSRAPEITVGYIHIKNEIPMGVKISTPLSSNHSS